MRRDCGAKVSKLLRPADPVKYSSAQPPFDKCFVAELEPGALL